MSGKIFLTAGDNEILVKPRGNGKVRVIASWTTNLADILANPLGIDIDLGVMWEALNGRKGAIQALGGQWGSHMRLPHLKLHGDDRTGGSGELIDGTARGLRRFGVYVYNCGGDAPLSKIQGMYVSIEIPGSQPIVVEFKNVNGPACGVLEVTQTDKGFFIQRTMYVARTSNQQLIDRHWNYGMSWSPATKAPRK